MGTALGDGAIPSCPRKGRTARLLSNLHLPHCPNPHAAQATKLATEAPGRSDRSSLRPLEGQLAAATDRLEAAMEEAGLLERVRGKRGKRGRAGGGVDTSPN